MQFTDQPALDFLSRLFPGGLRDSGWLAEVCPEGWEGSPLRLAFHPGPERRYQERCLFLTNMERLKCSGRPPQPVPTYQEFLANETAPTSIEGDPLDEWQELFGQCLWDVISDNHEVILATGDRVNFGSFRMVSALIDQFINSEALGDAWNCGDSTRFYMGTSFVRGRTDLRPVYGLIFRRLGSLGCRWHYSFPQIYAVRFEDRLENVDYNPSQSFAAGEERCKQDEDGRRLRERLDADLAERKEKAWDKAPPEVVQAYQDVFGEDPPGWPPDIHKPTK